MQYTTVTKNKAKNLRSKGKTYSEIRELLKLPIPKSTLSSWCYNVELPAWYQGKIDKLNHFNLTKAQKMAWISNNEKQKKLLADLKKRNQHIIKKLRDKDILKALLSILHSGEGSKWKYHRGLRLGNSDPNVIRLYMRLLKLCYGIDTNKLKCQINYRADQNINSLKRYWSHFTSIPLKDFYKNKPDPRTIGKPTKRKDYKGVCVISCAGTNIQLELETIANLISMGV